MVGAWLALAGCARPGDGPVVSAAGTELVVTEVDGSVLRGPALVGRTLILEGHPVRIGSVAEDPGARGGPVWLYGLQVADGAGGWRDLCLPDGEGRSAGFPVEDGRGGFELTCTSGAVGKCVRWGYRRWEEVPGGPPLAALHAACVRMTRADYCGDGASYTVPGVRIDFCDAWGIQRCEDGLPVEFEAAWDADGAVCAARTRVPALLSTSALGARCPAVRQDGCDAATPALLHQRVATPRGG